jgi:hypothetical protein
MDDRDILCGYRIEDLARVATLMEKCDIKPEDIKACDPDEWRE